MKRIKQDEVFESLNHFLKSKGIELKAGAYADRIHKACNLLGDTINATQSTARKAVHRVDKKLDEVRQCIHEATAPRSPQAAAPKAGNPRPPKMKKAQPGRGKPASPKRGK